MLTEDDLRELIDSAAAEAPRPEALPEELFHVAPTRLKGRSYRLLTPLAAVAVTFVLVLIGASVFSSGGTNKFSTVAGSIGGQTATTVAADGASFAGRDPAAAGAGTAATGADASTALHPAAPNAGVPSAPAPAQVAAAAPAAPVVDSARIIKNGSLEIRVGKGTVTESVNRITALATGFGGYVSDTRTNASAQSDSQASATITVRVPAASFEQLMNDTSKLGEVRATTTSGQDVTAQFTDIEAQLSALSATRDQFLLVLGEAKNVNDILAVQDRITQVQIQIDQLEGQKRLLTDQTSFGTLSVTVLEPGATVAVPPADDNNKDLGDAWRDARRNFGDALENIVGASGTIAVVLLCGAVLFSGGWFVYRTMRRRALTL
jgi:hypothetical protein